MRSLLLGLALLLLALWGGALVLHVLPEGDWRHFPVFATAFMTGLAGFALSIHGVSRIDL